MNERESSKVKPFTFLEPVTFWRYISIWEIFTIPVHLAFAYALWSVPDEQRAAAPFWRRFEDVASLEAWAIMLCLVTLVMIVGFAVSQLWMIRFSYALLSAFWLFLSFIAWEEARTLAGLTFYLSFANACLLRQAVLTVQRRERLR